MKNSICNSGKICFSILFMVFITMIFYATNSIAYEKTTTVIQIKTALEGYYNEDNGSLVTDALVEVYLRNVSEPYEIVDAAKGYIDMKSLTGAFTFYNLATGQYYIVIKSKNTIETWSKKGGELIVNGTKNMYDFTSGKEKAFGDNMKFSGKHASIYTGDVNQDGLVNEEDVEIVLKNAVNFTTGNVPEDLNGDGYVGKEDYLIVLKNAKGGIKIVSPMSYIYGADNSIIPMVTVQIKALIEGLFSDVSPIKAGMVKDPLVMVCLRNAEAPFEIVAETKGFIDRKTLTGTFDFWNVKSGQYYIVLTSWNSIETWSKKGGELIMNDVKFLYDFTSGIDKAFGDNMIFNGLFASIYTGDINQNGFIDKEDVYMVSNDIDKVKGDVATDLNGDQIVNELDFKIIYNNWEKNIQSLTPLSMLNPLIKKDAPEKSFTIKQNSPNPFNPVTMISFSITNTSNVRLSIYDMSGREIVQLENSILSAGDYNYVWNANNFASGTYFYRLNVNGFVQTMKMLLIK